MEYIKGDADPVAGHVSPFSALPQLGDDRKALIVHRAEHHYIVLNRYPYNPGHLLVVPFIEVAELSELSSAARAEMMELLVLAQTALRKAMHPDGFNIGFNLGIASGAGIPKHLHAHVVPRWKGDANFISVIGETRTLPQALDQTWDILTALFADA
jgi:ATP adenylyltransferase